MLRDGYYRMCEAYMNGALSKKQYQHMIQNADTFMVVISALQTLGTNPVAQNVGITTGTPTVTPGAAAGQAPGVSITGGNVTLPTSAITAQPTPKPKSAEMASQIVRDYLAYRYKLVHELAREEAQDRARKRRHDHGY